MFNRKKSLLMALVLLTLIVTGCLVSGTYPIVEGITFNFTADTGYYWYPIDMNDNEDWEEHGDKLDNIEAIGFDFNIFNSSNQTCTFTVMFKVATGNADVANPPLPFIPSNYTVVIDDLTVAAGATRHVTYAESLGMIQNQKALKQIIRTGRFDYLGTSCGGTDNDLFYITEGKIIITVSASVT